MADERQANPGFARWQLAKAFRNASTHPSAPVRAGAEAKARSWMQVIAGMLSGALAIGERAPVRDVPAWVTLEVLAGGFASGVLLAGGALLPHERALAERLGTPAERAALNGWFLTEDGLAELTRTLDEGTYRIDLPEEAALLVAAWLVREGREDDARALVGEIAPWFDRLRFYPRSDPRAFPARTTVHVQPVATTRAQLELRVVPPGVARLREAIEVWAPVTDRTVMLFLETVRDGWPCQVYPEDWRTRALALLRDVQDARQRNRLCRAPEHPRGNLGFLLEVLAVAAARPAQLTGKLVGRVRATLSQIDAKRGFPGSPRTVALRERQARQVREPRTQDFAGALAKRLEALRQDDALDEMEPLLAPVTAAEATRRGMEGQPIPAPLAALLARSLAAPLEDLIARGVIASGEVLARIAPQMTAQVRAISIADPAQRRLDVALYRAFRERRSLLLLNLQSQVKPGDLPWARPLLGARASDAVSAAARSGLAQVSAAYFRAFPHALTPNRLVTELDALAREAGLALPLVRELAADIFMGQFTATFLLAAQRAAAQLAGSLYETYYRVPFGLVAALPVPPRPERGAWISPELALLSYTRAGVPTPSPSRRRGRPAENGAVIEQAQVLTTHNLAVLFAELDLARELDAGTLADRTFAWVATLVDGQARRAHAGLIRHKNAAYAWRQLVFYLALCGRGRWAGFLPTARERAAAMRTPAARARVLGWLDDLEAAMEGVSPPHPVLGWAAPKC